MSGLLSLSNLTTLSNLSQLSKLEFLIDKELTSRQSNQVTATITQTVKIEFSTPNAPSLALVLTQEATRNLWHIKKYLDTYIAHLHGATTEEEFEQEARTFVREKNTLSDEQIKIFGGYLKSLLPDVEIDDLATILNVDFDRLADLFSLDGTR